MDHRTEKIYSDLGALCQPQAHISPLKERYKWNSASYETADISGTMLVSMNGGRPLDVELDPQLTGWYRIYVGQPVWSVPNQVNVLSLKLGSWSSFAHFAVQYVIYRKPNVQGCREIREALWCCADMTGETVQISKEREGCDMDAGLAWLRFVPMSQEEVDQLKADQLRKDTKRIYATNDMHGMIGGYGYDTNTKWREVVDEYLQSDVEWLSLENVLHYNGDVNTGDTDNFTYTRTEDVVVQKKLMKVYQSEMLRDVVAYGHEKGLKMCSSLRMGAWGMEFPYNKMYFDNKFMDNKEHLRCVDRDGSTVYSLSYAYPEVQEYLFDMLFFNARLGVDAVELMANRGGPYVMYEQPVIDRFMKEYGEDPRYLPLDDSRLVKVHCEIITEFFRELRRRLDKEFGKDKVRVHLRTLYSVYDNKIIGLDVEQLAAEGLINAVISYPQRVYWRQTDAFWQEDGVHVDIEKYQDYIRNCPLLPVCRPGDFNTSDPIPDSHGVLQGPADQQERVAQWMELEKKYGCQIYFEILPRFTAPEETRQRALELYRCGAEHISLWDTYNRVPFKVEWSMMRRLGHKEELEGYDSGEGEYYRIVPVLKCAGRAINRYGSAWGE